MNESIRIGYAFCGSFCTFEKSIAELKKLHEKHPHILPIMSETAYSTDTRFGKASEHISEIERICGTEMIHTITQAEPVGPNSLIDILVIAPCTGNTLAKLSNGITDSAVLMAAKAHLRNGKPVLLAIATNDGLSGSARNIGMLMRSKNIYFVPFYQDDFEKKPSSLVSELSLLEDAIEAALDGKQLQPLILQKA